MDAVFHRGDVGVEFRVVHPFAQQRAAVDDVDGQLAQFVLVGKVAPERVVGLLQADGLEGQRLQRHGWKAAWS
jgi:hypothetical protein